MAGVPAFREVDGLLAGADDALVRAPAGFDIAATALAGADLAGADLAGVDLAGADLAGALVTFPVLFGAAVAALAGFAAAAALAVVPAGLAVALATFVAGLAADVGDFEVVEGFAGGTDDFARGRDVVREAAD